MELYLYNCARIFLIRRALKQERIENCLACIENEQESQFPHMTGDGSGCMDTEVHQGIYQRALDNVKEWDIEFLFANLLSVFNVIKEVIEEKPYEHSTPLFGENLRQAIVGQENDSQSKYIEQMDVLCSLLRNEVPPNL